MLTQTRLKELLHYDPESGIFTRKVRTTNSVKVGDVAGTVDNTTGYLRITVDGKIYKAHRLAWLLHTGEWPVDQIDHANNVKTDNRIVNLRPATNGENNQNKGKNRSNTSGFKGVCFDKHSGKWRADIECPWGQKNLGRFKSKEEAARTYAFAACILHGTYVHVDTVIIINNYFQGESA